MGRPFSIGEVLGRAFPIWARNIVPLIILSAIIHSPLVLHALLAVPRDNSPRAWRSFAAVQNLGQPLLGFLATAAVIHGVFQQLRGQPMRIGDCLRVCFGRFFPVLLVALLTGLIIGLTAIPLGFLVAVRTDPIVIAFVGIATVVGATALYCTYWVAVPVTVVERPGIVASLRRSAALTRGSKLSIFVVMLVIGLVQLVPTMIVAMVLVQLAAAEVWAGLVVTIAFGALTAVASAVGYHDLRVAKEGVGIEDLVRVFS